MVAGFYLMLARRFGGGWRGGGRVTAVIIPPLGSQARCACSCYCRRECMCCAGQQHEQGAEVRHPLEKARLQLVLARSRSCMQQWLQCLRLPACLDDAYALGSSRLVGEQASMLPANPFFVSRLLAVFKASYVSDGRLEGFGGRSFMRSTHRGAAIGGGARIGPEHCAGELKGSSERRAHHCEAQRPQRERDSAARRDAQALASATMRFLHLVRPVMGLLPEVVMPDRKIP